MRELHNQIWVTSALSNSDVSKALVLCYSLRRSFTTRKIAAIVSSKISSELRSALDRAFDFVFELKEEQNTYGIVLEDFVKIFILASLRAFENCAYVSPNILILKKCDDIFSEETDGFAFLENSEDTSIFLFRPSLDKFENLLHWMKKPENNELGGNIKTKICAWEKELNLKPGKINSKFGHCFKYGTALYVSEQDLPLINLLQHSNEENILKLESKGIIEKIIVKYWLKIFRNDVLPLLKQSSTSLSSNHLKNDSQFRSIYSKEPIAVVGMSCRYPGSNNLEEFWNLLFEGQDGTGAPPSFRWPREHWSKQPCPTSKTNAGFLKVPIDNFDSKFFGISPKEVAQMDPQHRLLHELIWEGLEDACINPHTLCGTRGSVFIGSWLSDYKDMLLKSENPEFYRVYMGNSIGAAAARISFLLGMTGPSIATESGCSSAMVAVHLACRSLQAEETNLALACGVNLLVYPFNKDDMPMIVSPDGLCKSFSEDANGFGRAEGAGVLVLKRLTDALNDGDHIWGLIRGSAVSQEGVSKSMGTPTVYCESQAMREALRDSKILPEDVSYVETHGTGTPVGDPMEVAAIAEAYSSSNRKNPLIIGSVKTNVGHTESCSGITGIMKVILAMKHGYIPAHRNFTNLNPSINLSSIPAVLPLHGMEWKNTDGKPRIAGVSSFGITGTDAHVIVEEPPSKVSNIFAVNDYMERPTHILKLSAKTEEAMVLLQQNYNPVIKNSRNSLADIAFSANIGRADFSNRCAIIADDKDAVCSMLTKHNYLSNEKSPKVVDKICFLFTGQGSQYTGMAKTLYKTSPTFRIHFDLCAKIFNDMYNINIIETLWSNEIKDENKICRTIYSQTSIFCVEYALTKVWESWGVKPDFVLGHSLGEFAAAVCAGMLAVEDGVKLVAERSILIDQLPCGKMLVIKGDQELIDKAMKQFETGQDKQPLDYAATNSPDQTVIAGDSHTILEFSQFCVNNGIKCTLLEATHGFHSRHMDPILESYKAIADKVKYRNGGKCTYISGMKGDVMLPEQVNADYWVQHTREKVKFMTACKKAVELGSHTFVEIGPQPILCALTMVNNDGNLMCLPSLKRNEEEWKTMLTSLGKLYVNGFNIDWRGIDRFFNRKKVRLPHYPFIGKKFWVNAIQSTGVSIHPLIGSNIPNASSTQIFQSALDLKDHEYIKDHVVGSNIIFPGAGYLEICLAAGLATIVGATECLNKPTRPMKVENLTITAPLALDESKTCHIQTIVEHGISNETEPNWTDLKVKIFHRVESELDTKWLSHATANFSPLATAEEQGVNLSKENFKDILQRRFDIKEIKQTYEKLANVGLNFGHHFLSLECLWQNQDGTFLIKIKSPLSTQQQLSSYIVHPVVLDAMIQAIILPKLQGKLKRKLFVPIKIGKFIWLSNSTDKSPERYVYVFQKPSSSLKNENVLPTALLLDSTGHGLAVMSDVELIDTTVKTLESVLEQQTSAFPQMWDEIWCLQRGSMSYPHNTSLCTSKKFCTSIFYDHIVQNYDNLTPQLEFIIQNLRKLSFYNILRCLYQCGFQPHLNSMFSVTDLHKRLNIESSYLKLFCFYMQILEEENIIKYEETDKCRVVSIPPTLEQVDKELASNEFVVDLVRLFKSTLLFMKVGEMLKHILQGKLSALNILFPDEKSNNASVPHFYTEYGTVTRMTSMINSIYSQASFLHCKAHASGSREILRICEIGAGTGWFTQPFLESLASCGIEFEYMYTDISAAFFSAAEKKFADYAKNITFRKLNIEEDPISQGFVPAYFDIIVAADVIHATKNIKSTLNNVKLLLKPNGRFDIFEMTRKNRYLTYLFGLLDGFWRFEDFNVRPDHCTLTMEGWRRLLDESGFSVIEAFPGVNGNHTCICTRLEPVDKQHSERYGKKGKTWIVFHEKSSITSQFLLEAIPAMTNRRCITVIRGKYFQQRETGNHIEFTIREQCEQDYFDVIEAIKNSNISDVEGFLYCWSLKRDCHDQPYILKPLFYVSNSILGMMKKSSGLRVCILTQNVVSLEQDDNIQFPKSTIWGFTKAFQNERADLKCRLIDIGNNETEEQLQTIFHEIWNSGMEVQVAIRGSSRYIPKLTPIKPSFSDLNLPPASNRFQLVLPETKSITDLRFDHLALTILKPFEIEIQVKASALNFKDVLNVLKPSEDFKNSHAVGFDFAGVVKSVHPSVSKWSVGDNVFGVNTNGNALPSHIRLHEDDVIRVPEKMTLAEACTLPAVTITSYYCLVDVANVTSTDTVLIHTASGGVGLSAIQLCKHIGASIIATAGSKRKQNYLRSLGIQHVFYSRNTEFSENILKVTSGRGVDVVLNSLTGEGFKEASLRACAKGARFVEMSKLSIWKPEEVKQLRPDVQYTIIDVSEMKAEQWRHYSNKLDELIQNKVISPIPYVRFNAVNIREALQFLQKAKHIGKVVCIMPEVKQCSGVTKTYTPMFNPRSTYLITGGLGGVGLEICKWMLEHDAKYVLLAGRKPPTDNMIADIAELNEKYCSNVQTVQLNVANFDECKKLFSSNFLALKLPPLRGVMHAAGTLSDGLVENQTWDTLSSTFGAKVYGTLNLHELTKSDSQIEHFVLFSSMAALFGSPGQSNHCAANQFEDAMAQFRNSVGLPATTVNWGHWGEVGVATDVDFPGLKPITNHQAKNSLDFILKSQRTQTAVLNVESFAVLSKLHPQLSAYVDETAWNSTSNNFPDLLNMKSDDFWQQYNMIEKFDEKVEYLKNILRLVLNKILRLEDADIVQDTADFQEIGIDSLMFVELKNCLQTLFGDTVVLSVSTLRDCTTIQTLAQELVHVIGGSRSDYVEIPTPEEVNQLIREDAILPEHITPKHYQKRIKITEISHILLTGVTGTLGPYVLKDLCERFQVTQITCLVRPKKNLNPTIRLEKILEERDLLSDIDMSKVRVVSGNVAETHFHLEDETWKELVDNVDAVFHCAASIQHMEIYRRDDRVNSMRSVNIGGVKNVVEFCCSGTKLKYFFNASSMVGVATLNSNGSISDNWPELEDFNGVTHLGYPNTKFVCDLLLKEAVTQRGIPGKSFRFPLISGDSKTGMFILDQNHLMLRYIFALKSGIMGNTAFPLAILPVDVAVNVACKLFFNPNVPDDIYNIVNLNPSLDVEFVSVAERLGHTIKIVEFEQFSQTVKEMTDDTSPLAMFTEFYSLFQNESDLLAFFNAVPALRSWLLEASSKEDFFFSKKLATMVPEFYESHEAQISSMTFIYNDLKYAKKNGLLKKFGL